MSRLIIVFALIAAVAIAITALLGTMQAVITAVSDRQEGKMPTRFQKFAYLVLLILMFGITTGWVGGV